MEKAHKVTWPKYTKQVLAIGFILVLVALAGYFMLTSFRPTTKVYIGSGVYSLWLADTQPKLVQGLSGVKSLHPDGGLLMDFGTNSYHGIWMKDMNFPLDIVWLDKEKKVVYVVQNALPEEPAETIYAPKNLARYVLELPTGSIQKAAIKVGTIADFSIDV